MSGWLNRCHFGDVRDVLRRMIADGVKVNTIITSPPYWGLRSYLPDEHPDKPREIGSEPTLREFLANMVEVFDLARQVLANDGTAWVNMGDSYCGTRGAAWSPSPSSTEARAMTSSRRRDDHPVPRSDVRVEGLKPKDMVGQPWRLALALQDGTCRCSACGLSQATSAWHLHNGHRVCVDCLMEGNREAKVLPESSGWWLRSDIIWHKPNPMPESVRDRPTKAHEYLFLLAKSEQYFFDFEGWKEPVSGGAHARRASNGVGFGHGFDENPKPRQTWGDRTPAGWVTGATGRAHDEKVGRYSGARAPGNVNPAKGQAAYEAGDSKHRTKAGLLAYAQRVRKLADVGSGTKNNSSMDEALATMPEDRNRRSVWTIPTEAFKGAHFATYPQKLVEPCVLAGCPVGGTVLDIFFGSGTTGQVAQRLGRNWIGIDLNPANEPLQRDRSGPQPALHLEHV